jgi:hypothetical protein
MDNDDEQNDKNNDKTHVQSEVHITATANTQFSAVQISTVMKSSDIQI